MPSVLNSRSLSRKIVWPLMMILTACAHQRPGSGAPVTGGMRISVESLIAADRLKPDQVFHAELAHGQPLPGTGTVELFQGYNASGKSGSGPIGSNSDGGDVATACNSPTPLTILPCSFLAVGMLAAVGVVLVTTPIWAVPVGLARGEFGHRSRDQAGETATPGKTEASGRSPEIAEDGRQREAFVAQVRKAMAVEELSLKLDDAHTATLKQNLERPGPDRGSVRVLAGLSRISLARTPQGDESLTVCSRAMVENDESRWRHFETCLSEPVTPAQYGSAEWVREALVSQTQKLALSMAGALRGE
jgi:hypothetical protein